MEWFRERENVRSRSLDRTKSRRTTRPERCRWLDEGQTTYMMTITFEDQIRLELVDERFDKTSTTREDRPVIEHDAEGRRQRTLLRLFHDRRSLAANVRLEHVDVQLESNREHRQRFLSRCTLRYSRSFFR